VWRYIDVIISLLDIIESENDVCQNMFVFEKQNGKECFETLIADKLAPYDTLNSRGMNIVSKMLQLAEIK
jgi:hypothetical protein